jgi:hypothetical protein
MNRKGVIEMSIRAVKKYEAPLLRLSNVTGVGIEEKAGRWSLRSL